MKPYCSFLKAKKSDVLVVRRCQSALSIGYTNAGRSVSRMYKWSGGLLQPRVVVRYTDAARSVSSVNKQVPPRSSARSALLSVIRTLSGKVVEHEVANNHTTTSSRPPTSLCKQSPAEYSRPHRVYTSSVPENFFVLVLIKCQMSKGAEIAVSRNRSSRCKWSINNMEV